MKGIWCFKMITPIFVGLKKSWVKRKTGSGNNRKSFVVFGHIRVFSNRAPFSEN